jgi:hypothetical protein
MGSIDGGEYNEVGFWLFSEAREMATLAPVIDDAGREIQPDEANELIDAAARRYLKMSGREFLRLYESGEFSTRPELAHKVSCVAMLLPLIHH